MKYIILFFFTLSSLSKVTANDSPEVLEWVQKISMSLESRLNDAVTYPDAANLLIKLMECYEDFDAIAMMGLYCHDARIAAEQGRNQCNWINFIKEKDVSSLTVRAQEARLQAYKMRDAVTNCLMNRKEEQPLSTKTLTFASMITSNADAIEHDLSDGLASNDFHIMAQKIEHAERVFHDTEVLAQKLSNCTPVLSASRDGLLACADALASKEWPQVQVFAQKAIDHAMLLKKNAMTCR